MKSKKDKIPDIKQACNLIINENINPAAFNNTGSNPNSNTVKEIFKDVGVSEIFKNIQDRFEQKWNSELLDRELEKYIKKGIRDSSK